MWRHDRSPWAVRGTLIDLSTMVMRIDANVKAILEELDVEGDDDEEDS
jgi:hypothetical protein